MTRFLEKEEIDQLAVGSLISEHADDGSLSRYRRQEDGQWLVEWSDHPAWELVKLGVIHIRANTTEEFVDTSRFTVIPSAAPSNSGLLTASGTVEGDTITQEDINNAMAVDDDDIHDAMDAWEEDDE